jgi:signal transduction histidine kinase
VTPRIPRRRPVRLRLTLTYGGLFLLGGAVLIAFIYVFVATAPSFTPAQGTPPSRSLAAACAKLKQPAPPADANLVKKCHLAFRSGLLQGAADQRAQALHDLLLYSGIGLGAVGVVAGGVGWVVAGRALRPVHAITSAARRASEENLGERLSLGGPPDELKELADTFDAMLERLDAAFASQRRFVANASHELRTPLTVMRTAIDVTLAKPSRTAAQLEHMAAEVRQAADRAEALIEALLTLARSDRGVQAREESDLAVLAEDALDTAAPAARAASLRVQTALRPAPVAGDVVLLARLAANLVDNAVRHNVAQGWIQVASGTGGGTVFLTVSNSGPQIDAEVAPQLLEPFRRLADRTAADGAGLGLSIVASVAVAHHGQVSAHALAAGGLEVTVVLPALPAAPDSPAALPGAGTAASAALTAGPGPA